MSFIVKGVDLPKGGELLTVNIYNGFITVYTVTPKDTVIEHKVEAIQIPKDHGRLIDGDKLKLARHDIYVEEINYRHRCIHIENIDEAPTILEAESEERV